MGKSKLQVKKKREGEIKVREEKEQMAYGRNVRALNRRNSLTNSWRNFGHVFTSLPRLGIIDLVTTSVWVEFHW